MILERVYDLALPRLADRKIKDVRIGLELMAVELDNGSIGVTYVLRKEAEHACMALPQAGRLIGMSAQEIAGWALRGGNVINVAAGLAVLNSVAEFDKITQNQTLQGVDAVFSVDIKPDDTIGIIGHIGPVISRLRDKNRKMYIFERGDNNNGQIYKESDQPKLLPECQVVFITSSTLINGTLENLLNYCSNARDVVMVGSSTPLYPEAFCGTKVTALSGTRWLPSNRDSILTQISQCAGMRQLIKNGQKISVNVMK